MSTKSPLFKRVVVAAISVLDAKRANRFYGETLGLTPAYEEEQQVGYLVGETILMLKDDWDQPPVQNPNPRITLETDSAYQTEKELRSRGVVISDPVEIYDKVHAVGSFLDTEGNKIWFCSYISG
jgi:catechol 2,3-dioxygenase-like lactoylglutathione lyase family enzyme